MGVNAKFNTLLKTCRPDTLEEMVNQLFMSWLGDDTETFKEGDAVSRVENFIEFLAADEPKSEIARDMLAELSSNIGLTALVTKVMKAEE